MAVQYCGSYNDKCGDILSTMELFGTVVDYLEYRVACSVLCKNIMIHVGISSVCVLYMRGTI